MRSARLLLVLAALLLPGTSTAAGQANPPDELGPGEAPSSDAGAASISGAHDTRLHLGVAYEHLSNGYGPWRSASLGLHAAGRDGGALYAVVQETTRFMQRDYEVMAGAQHRLSSRLMAVVEAETSPSHHVSATWGVLGRLELDAGNGWGVHASLRHRRYTAATADLSSMTLERYLGRYRAAYTLYVSRLDGGGVSASHRVHGDLYYGRLSSSVGVGVSVGEELENVQPIGVLETQVRAAAVVGRQWLTPTWFVMYDALLHEQGALYTRRRLSLSLGHRF